MNEKKRHDIFNPGVNEDQIRRAEELLDGWSVPSFVEKRDLSEDYQAGVLRSLDRDATNGFEVMLSRHPVPEHQHHVALGTVEMPAMQLCEITIRRAGQLHVMVGRLEPGYPGRRDEDHRDGKRLMVSFFYPE
ncbi:MAG: hypothetical protein RQ741_05395 [Wenzhouxiangellaceae bacterium]|nr:hypothetical protein [Wenzhouxiangellaceae bacterium]